MRRVAAERSRLRVRHREFAKSSDDEKHSHAPDCVRQEQRGTSSLDRDARSEEISCSYGAPNGHELQVAILETPLTQIVSFQTTRDRKLAVCHPLAEAHVDHAARMLISFKDTMDGRIIPVHVNNVSSDLAWHLSGSSIRRSLIRVFARRSFYL